MRDAEFVQADLPMHPRARVVPLHQLGQRLLQSTLNRLAQIVRVQRHLQSGGRIEN